MAENRVLREQLKRRTANAHRAPPPRAQPIGRRAQGGGRSCRDSLPHHTCVPHCMMCGFTKGTQTRWSLAPSHSLLDAATACSRLLSWKSWIGASRLAFWSNFRDLLVSEGL